MLERGLREKLFFQSFIEIRMSEHGRQQFIVYLKVSVMPAFAHRRQLKKEVRHPAA